MGDVVSRVKLFINYSGGNFQLKRVDSGKVKFDADSDIVLALGVDGGAGFRDKTGGGELTLDVYAEEGDPEVNYFTLWATKEKFGFVMQFGDNGLRFQFRNVKVTKPADLDSDTSGKNMFTVTLKFLQFGLL